MTCPARKLSYVHRGGETPLIGSTIDGWFGQVVARFPDHEAVVCVPQRRRLSYRELDHQVQALARGLLGLGVGRGERVGIWATNNTEWIVVQMATARVGAVLVNVNPAYRVSELAYALERARPRVVITMPRFKTSDYVGMLREVCPELDRASAGDLSPRRFPQLHHVVVYDPADAAATARPAPGFLLWSELLERGAAVDDEQVARRGAELDMDDPINIQFTSGTTGFPKAVVLTHRNVLNNAYFEGENLAFTEHDRLCVPVPFYHCFGMVISNLLCLARGATIVIPAAHFDAGAVLRAVQDERCTALHGVPTMFVAELEHEAFRDFDLSSLRTGVMAGAPCPPELVRRVMDEMGCREILIGYGQTEAAPITHSTRRDDSFERRVQSVGTNLPHQEVKVVDPLTGATVPVGTQGEVCFRGYHVMRGYFEDPEATRQAIDEKGWLHSGDLGELDEDGYLRITGRLKDMIIRGGENVYPAEVEALYWGHPKVAEVAVFGLPDEKMGEEIGMWIKLHEGQHADPEELREWARTRIAHYKVPRHVWIVDAFPMTVTGKIQKFRIREMARELLARAPLSSAPAAR